MIAGGGGFRHVCVFLAALMAPSLAARAEMVCLDPPYSNGSGEIAALAERTLRVVAAHPSLDRALDQQAPVLCLDDTLYEEQGYFEPKTRRIVLRKGLDADFQLAIMIHEIRHLEQFGREVCPTIGMTLVDYVRTRQALEADASAISIYVAWQMRAAGDSGPWNALAAWPTQDDLAESFAAEISASGDPALATAAAYAAWFNDNKRRELYAFVSCVNYLDALDREKMDAGTGVVGEDFTKALCRMPDGRPYDCALPP